MACRRLGHRPERVLRIAMPGRDGRHYVATHTPGELADLFATARELTDTERADLAADYGREFLAVDRCLDAGRVYDYREGHGRDDVTH